jgi:hypothetical protein
LCQAKRRLCLAPLWHDCAGDQLPPVPGKIGEFLVCLHGSKKVSPYALGLVPRQISTEDRTILGKISKRGNRYLRVLFVQAAWVVLVKVKPNRWEGHGLKPWIEAAKKRLHHIVLAIALANKLARIAWSVLARGRVFEASKLHAA